jgi:hypothetical protein
LLKRYTCVLEVLQIMNKATCLPLLSSVFLLLVISERPAEAYIDPGTASYVFQVIAGAVLGGVFLLRTYWSRVVTSVRSLVSRDDARHS